MTTGACIIFCAYVYLRTSLETSISRYHAFLSNTALVLGLFKLLVPRTLVNHVHPVSQTQTADSIHGYLCAFKFCSPLFGGEIFAFFMCLLSNYADGIFAIE